MVNEWVSGMDKEVMVEELSKTMVKGKQNNTNLEE